MLKLNFLPHRQHRHTRHQQQFYGVLGVVLAAGAACVGVADMLLERQITQQDVLLQMLHSEHQRLDLQLRDAALLQEKIAELAQQQQHIESVRRRQNQTTQLLQTLAEQTPAGVQLRGLKQQAARISLSGSAAASGDVMQLLANLRTEGGALRHAQLQETHVAAAAGGAAPRYDFSIAADSATIADSPLAPPPGKVLP